MGAMDPKPTTLDPRIRSLLMTSIGTLRAVTTLSAADDEARPLPQPTLPLELGSVDPSGQAEYRLIERIGEGQSARVFKAIVRRMSDRDHARHVAVKMFRATTDPSHFEAARTEALRTDRVRSEHVVRVFDVGLWQERWPYVVQDYWKAKNLEQWATEAFAEGTPLPSVETCVRIVRGAACGVRAAHAEEIIHRDVAPRNILVCADGVTRITDFGCAALGEGQSDLVVVGTPGFMPPEQWRRGANVKQSDVAALGGILYWLLTGHLPYGNSAAEIAAAHQAPAMSHAAREIALVESNAPPPIATAILQATHPDLLLRTPSAAAFIDALDGWLGTLAPRRRLPWVRVVGAAAVVVIAAVVGDSLRDKQPSSMPRADGAALAAWFGTTLDDPALLRLRAALAEVGAFEPGPMADPGIPAKDALAVANRRRSKLQRDPEALFGSARALAVAGLAIEAGAWEDADYWLAVGRDKLNSTAIIAASDPERNLLHDRWNALFSLVELHDLFGRSGSSLASTLSERDATRLVESLDVAAPLHPPPGGGVAFLSGTFLHRTCAEARNLLLDAFPKLRSIVDPLPSSQNPGEARQPTTSAPNQ